MADNTRKEEAASADSDTAQNSAAEVLSDVVVPSHHPLPLPPEVLYTRPPSVRDAAAGTKTAARIDSRTGQDDAYGAVSHGAGLAAGTTFVVSIVAGAMAGNWIDIHWIRSSMPWGTLVMTLVGAAAGFLNLQRILARTNRDRDNH